MVLKNMMMIAVTDGAPARTEPLTHMVSFSPDNHQKSQELLSLLSGWGRERQRGKITCRGHSATAWQSWGQAMICLTSDLLGFLLLLMEKKAVDVLSTYCVSSTMLDTLFQSLIRKYHFLESLYYAINREE